MMKIFILTTVSDTNFGPYREAKDIATTFPTTVMRNLVQEEIFLLVPVL